MAKNNEIELSEVKTYQAIKFGKNHETTFTAARPVMKNIRLFYDPSLLLIRAVMEGVDAIYIFPSNVEYAKPL